MRRISDEDRACNLVVENRKHSKRQRIHTKTHVEMCRVGRGDDNRVMSNKFIVAHRYVKVACDDQGAPVCGAHESLEFGKKTTVTLVHEDGTRTIIFRDADGDYVTEAIAVSAGAVSYHKKLVSPTTHSTRHVCRGPDADTSFVEKHRVYQRRYQTALRLARKSRDAVKVGE